jgi:hypothetical protein
MRAPPTVLTHHVSRLDSIAALPLLSLLTQPATVGFAGG